MLLADQMYRLLKRNRWYQDTDTHSAAYAGRRLELTYQHGVVVIADTSFSLSRNEGEEKKYRCTKKEFAQWIRQQSEEDQKKF